MKKRLFCLLLALTLLSGCAQADIGLPEQTTEPTAQETAPTEPVGYQTLSSGVTVRADYSNYRPVGTLSAQFTRISDKWIDDLQAVSDCETIYPFAGTAVYAGWQQSETFSGFTYGIADDKGRILADPVYESVYPLYDSAGSYDGLGTALPAWVLQKRNEVEQIEYEVDDQTYYYAQASYRLAVAALDGSFVTPCKYTNVCGFPDAFLGLTEEDGAVSFELMDFQGNLLLSSKDIEPEGELSGESYYYSYADGLLTVPIVAGREPSKWSEFGDDYEEYCDVYYVDLNGKAVLGPYDAACSFSEGLAFVRKDDVGFFIDRDGNNAFGTTYSGYIWEASFLNDTAIVSTGDGRDRLLDRDGRVLLEGESLWRYGSDRVIRNEDGSQLCDLKGNVLCTLDDDWWPLGSKPEMLVRQSTPCAVKTFDGSVEYSVPNSFYIFSGNGLTLADGREVAFLAYCNNDDPDASFDHAVAYDAECNELFRVDMSAAIYTDSFTGQAHLVGQPGASFFPLDNEQKPIVRATEVNYYNGLLVASSELGCSVYDASGKLIFCYPFLADD